MKRSHWILFGLLLSILTLCGCSGKPPDAEKAAADQAMEKAKQLQADKVAGMDWSSAMQKYKDAELQIKMKRYADARMFFEQAKVKFENATKAAEAKRGDYLKEVQASRELIGSNYAKIKTLLSGNKVSAKAKKNAQVHLKNLDQLIADFDKLIADGDVLNAKLMSKEVQEKSFALLNSLEVKK
jgi:predicted small lipoprotein YifL